MLVSGRPIRGGTGDVVGGVIVCHDVTAGRQAHKALAERAEELARSNRELQQLAYVAAHDLQEPLRMVASYVELVAERYKGRLDEKADKYINYAVEGADRMKALVDALRGFLVLTTQARPSSRWMRRLPSSGRSPTSTRSSRERGRGDPQPPPHH